MPVRIIPGGTLFRGPVQDGRVLATWRRRGRIRAVAALVSSLLVLVACSSSPARGPTQSSTSLCPSNAAARRTLGTKISRAIGPDFGLGPSQGRQVRAVLVSVCGKTVLERYQGATASDSRNIASVTKSFVSSLVGLALADGSLRSLDQTLVQLLPNQARFMTPAVASTTLRQLLTMTAGLDQDLSDGEFGTWTESTNFVRSILRDGVSGPVKHEFGYSSASSHLLAAILTRATGRPLLDYARARLFDPLGINTRPAAQPTLDPAALLAYNYRPGFAWPIDGQGNSFGAAFLKITPRDMLKLGQLYLNGGRWNGKQVLPAAWVRAATTAQVPTDGGRGGQSYGYQWWVTTAGQDPAYAAVGFGGQLIEVVPRRKLVIVFSSEIGAAPVGTARLEFLASETIAPTATP
jgi:CubicO group peptidase (beta-lactamase class C family)